MKPTRFPLALSIALLACASACKPAAKADEAAGSEAAVSVQTAKVERRDIRELLPADGLFAPATGESAHLSFAVAGRIGRFYVSEGQKVRKGQILAALDLSVLGAQRSSAAYGALGARAQASQTAAALRATQAEYQSTVAAARLNLDATITEQQANVKQARIDLERLRNGSRPQEIAQAEQTVLQARIARDRSKRDWDRARQLLAEGYISGQDADAAKAGYETAESTLTQASEALSLTRAGSRGEDIRGAESRLEAAQVLADKRIQAARASLKQAEEGRLNVLAKSEELSAANLAASQKAADSLAAGGSAAQGEIRAPFDGTITQRHGSVGDAADPAVPTFEIVQAGAHFEFSGSVSSADAVKLRVGMDALTDEGAQGMVLAVGVLDSATGQVPIRIRFAGLSLAGTKGGFGRVRIVLKRYANALTVPASAVLSGEGGDTVFTVDGEKAKLKHVVTGPTEGDRTAILKGITASDLIVTVGQHELSDAASITVAEPETAKKDGEAAP